MNKGVLSVVVVFGLIFVVMLASQLFTPSPQHNASHYPPYPGYLPRGGGSVVVNAPPPLPVHCQGGRPPADAPPARH